MDQPRLPEAVNPRAGRRGSDASLTSIISHDPRPSRAARARPLRRRGRRVIYASADDLVRRAIKDMVAQVGAQFDPEEA